MGALGMAGLVVSFHPSLLPSPRRKRWALLRRIGSNIRFLPTGVGLA